jgi:hypothetical protein
LLGLPVAVIFLMLTAASARAAAPVFRTTRLPVPNTGDGTEPRVSVAPDGTTWVVTTNGTQGGDAVVFGSKDGGATFTKTESDIPGQVAPTIDVDIVTEPDGRIFASELDAAGLNFPSGYSDDGGKTWTASQGTRAADQDRQWFAVGPKDEGTGKYTVYLLYHNLATGFGNHNMYVQKSADGGATFGAPVPTTVPGQDAFADLQCGDSGGPSTIMVDQRTGEIYVVFTTRAATLGNIDAGGCAAPLVGQPIEINVVAGTRVWVSRSQTGEAGTWTPSLAVDKNTEGHIVSMQLAYGALDSTGNIYVAYPESPHPFPDYSGGAVRYVFAAADNDGSHPLQWSSPRQIAPEDDSGNTSHQLVHMVVGAPGQMSVAYMTGFTRPDGKADFYLYHAQTQDGLAATPKVEEQRISDVRAYSKFTPSEMMAACGDPDNPAQGIENGFECDRATDVWGIALDRSCGTVIAWPTGTPNQTEESEARRGTYVSSQTGGPALCEKPPAGAPQSPAAATGQPQPPGAVPAGVCPDRIPPQSRFRRRQPRSRRTLLRFSGTSKDVGCVSSNGVGSVPGKVRTVYVSVAKVRGGAGRRHCRFINKRGRITAARRCQKPILLRARGGEKWSFRLKTRRLPRGHYRVVARGVDVSRNKERPAKGRNIRKFTLR